ncbi:hypothetical protein WNY37_00810 [Henriciella sp. AS95]|uniref:hypothetical protein n=1 Tax=Henriciella sp. AS95 TaxID=3135782 RepID=UPI00316FF275
MSFQRNAGAVTAPHAQTPVWPLFAFGCVAILRTLLNAGPAFGGDLLGPDDMMRMQQVRDLITGQNGWYDVNQVRLLTPEGGAMHWSRLPDLFLAGTVWMLQPLFGREMAEGIAVTAWPAFLLAWAFTAITVCLRRLNAPLSGQIAALFFFLTSYSAANFMPGRVDHHGLGLVLTLTALACLLSPKMTIRSGLVAGVCVAAMLTVAIENLPAAMLTIAGFAMAWIIRGEPEAPRLRAFGATLIIAGLITYIFDAPGVGGVRNICDAFGQSHFVALLVAGTGLSAIGTAMPRTPDWKMRIAAMAIAGAVTSISFVVINPSCVGDPYTRLSGDVQAGWLSVVSEARSLPTVLSSDRANGAYYYGFGLAGLVAAAIAVYTSRKGERFSRVSLLVLCAVGFLLSAWQVRGTTLAHAGASIAAGWLFGVLFSTWLTKRGAMPALALFVGALILSPAIWKSPTYLFSKPDSDSEAAIDCKSGEAFQAIAAAPRMIVFTPIDLGAPLIYHTRHYASAAPYHRNPSSIEMTMSVFGGSTDTARRKISMTGATHLLYCPGLGELETYAARSPDGFAADIENGNLPDWLVPLTAPVNGESGPIIYTILFEQN